MDYMTWANILTTKTHGQRRKCEWIKCIYPSEFTQLDPLYHFSIFDQINLGLFKKLQFRYCSLLVHLTIGLFANWRLIVSVGDSQQRSRALLACGIRPCWWKSRWSGQRRRAGCCRQGVPDSTCGTFAWWHDRSTVVGISLIEIWIYVHLRFHMLIA